MEKNNFLLKFKKIIRECNYDNTYKMAMAKSLVEISLENTQNGLVQISLSTHNTPIYQRIN